MKHALRVLIADDDHAVADSLGKLIRMWGYDVLTAYDGTTAVEMARVPT